MPENTEDLELKDRLNLIENMIAEGRRTTESWGWTFVLWGVAYYVAILWTGLAHSYLAWPVTMTVACVLMGVVIARRRAREPRRTTGRAIAAVWISMGISTFILLMSLGFSGIADQHSSIAVVGTMLATANAASSIILKWKLQFACAMVWWALTVYACFGGGNGLTIAFLAAIFLCQIVFGVYGMIAEARRCRQGALHA